MKFKDKAVVIYIGVATWFATAYGIHNTVQYVLNRPYYCLKCKGPIESSK